MIGHLFSSLVVSLLTLTGSALAAPAAVAQPASAPILALWEYDGWAAPTAERPLGLRFVLLEDGRVIFSPDDPAWDHLIPAGFYQAQLSADEAAALIGRIDGLLREADWAHMRGPEGKSTAFYVRNAADGAARRAEFAGHPCLARGRVFSATAPVQGLQAVRNTEIRLALPTALHDACNLLTQFFHASAREWNPAELPAPIAVP